MHEEKVPHPVSPYGASKLAGEAYCSAYFRSFGVETVALRFGNVYGPGSSHKNSVVVKFIRQSVNGDILEIYGDGHQTRDFIYMDDLIEAICLAARVDGIAGEIFQIATFKETTVNDIAVAIKQIVEKETNKKVKFTHSEPRIGDVRRNYSDISKAKKMLGFKPRYDLKRGLEETFLWFLKELTPPSVPIA